MPYVQLACCQKSCQPPTPLSVSFQRSLIGIIAESLLPTEADITRIMLNLTTLVCRFMCVYIKGLHKFAKLVPNHIYHSHSKDMAEKSEVAVLDVLHKNEASHVDMLDIMKEQQSYVPWK